MRKHIHWFVFVAVMSLLVAPATARTPTVTVYFDENLTMRSLDLGEPGMVTLYIVAEGFNSRVSAIEYKVDYPAGLTWVSDVDVPPVRIGTTAEGITQAWQHPIDASDRVVIATATARWDPSLGSGGEVTVSPHPIFGWVRAAVAPDFRIVEADGEISQVGQGDHTPSTRNKPVLYGASPNPFNPSTHISFFIPRSEHVRLNVYDVTGRLITQLLNEVQSRGDHTVEWSADNMPSGVYFFQLEAGDFSQQKKVMLLK